MGLPERLKHNLESNNCAIGDELPLRSLHFEKFENGLKYILFSISNLVTFT